MPEDDIDLLDDLDPEPDPPAEEPSALRRVIAKKDAEAKAERARADAAERQLAIRDSGLDLSDPKVAFFADKYDGDNTPEAVKQAALAAGFLQPPPPEVPDTEVQTHAQVETIAAGADSGEIPWEEKAKTARSSAELDEIMRAGGVEFAPGR